MKFCHAVGAFCVLITVTSPVPAASALATSGHIVVVQALPGEEVDVAIDGRSVEVDVAVGEVLGPFPLPAGSHEVTFSGMAGQADVTSSLDVAAGSSTDVVVHLPAAVDGEAIVNSYATPTEPIGPDKARVLVAHTATVAPADVRVDGQTVFTNIANGEFATADVPAGTHEVALLPTGTTTNPILGPADLTLDEGTVSMVYAYGNPDDGSMNVILHSATLTADGTVIPSTIGTGSAGLAADLTVVPFGEDATSDAGSSAHGTRVSWLGSALFVLVIAVAALALVQRGRGSLTTRKARSGPS